MPKKAVTGPQEADFWEVAITYLGQPQIKYGCATDPSRLMAHIPHFPEKIPCNVCSRGTALKNIFRKHADNGSWQPLERDIFLYKFMGEAKSPFLIMEEATGIISQNPHLNRRFVKEEIFRKDILASLGFTCQKESLHSVHSAEEAYAILSDISRKIENQEISTRKNRGKIIEVLDPVCQQLIDENKNNKPRLAKIEFGFQAEIKKEQRQSRRTPKVDQELFGGKLYLRMGDVSNLYRDIASLYQFYLSNKNSLSEKFPGLIRMSLRLLCETAAKEDSDKKFDNYLKGHFAAAKKTLNKDIKTTLSNHNVNENSIVQLLHTGAHNYESANNIEQTMAMSVIVGSILTISHGKEK